MSRTFWESASKCPANSFFVLLAKTKGKFVEPGILAEWLIKWQVNGWKTAKGGDVVNRAYFELLLIEVEELESVSFKVLFWHVGREFNREQIGRRI
jgi:ribonuclease HI